MRCRMCVCAQGALQGARPQREWHHNTQVAVRAPVRHGHPPTRHTAGRTQHAARRDQPLHANLQQAGRARRLVSRCAPAHNQAHTGSGCGAGWGAARRHARGACGSPATPHHSGAAALPRHCLLAAAHSAQWVSEGCINGSPSRRSDSPHSALAPRIPTPTTSVGVWRRAVRRQSQRHAVPHSL